MRGAILRGDVVTNIVVYDEGWTPEPPDELVPLEDVTEPVGPGYRFDGVEWSAPDLPPVVPLPPPPTTEELLARLEAQEARVDALLLAGIDDSGGTLDGSLDDLLDLPDDGGSLDDLEGLADLGLADHGESLDDLLPKG